MAMQPSTFNKRRRRQFRRIPVRTLVPNVITLLALCAGLTAIRMAFENRYTWALYGHRLRRDPRRPRRKARAIPEGDLAVRRRTRQPVGLRQLWRRPGADPLFLGSARAEIGRVDRGHGVRHLRRGSGSHVSM